MRLNRAFGFPWMVVTRPDGQTANFFGSEYVLLTHLETVQLTSEINSRFESMASFLDVKYAGPFPEGRANL